MARSSPPRLQSHRRGARGRPLGLFRDVRTWHVPRTLRRLGYADAHADARVARALAPCSPHRRRGHARVALAARAAGMDASGAARGRGRGGPVLRVGHGWGRTRAVLRRGREEHVDELARLPVRRVRSRGDGDRRQAARRAVAAGPVAADLRLSRVGDRAAAGDRGRADGAGAVPGDEAARGSRGGHRRRGDPRAQPGDGGARTRC
jgi:hypothetical protein